MSFGNYVRNLIDPPDPAVAAWLRRELPKLVQADVLDVAQADAIAQRYGVGSVAGADTLRPPSAQDVAPTAATTSGQPATASVGSDARRAGP